MSALAKKISTFIKPVREGMAKIGEAKDKITAPITEGIDDIKTRFNAFLSEAIGDDKGDVDVPASKKSFDEFIPNISGSVQNKTLKGLMKRISTAGKKK